MKRLVLLMAAILPLSAQIKLPAFTRDVLPNGSVVYLMQRPGLPLVNF